MDNKDKKILKALQDDATLTVNELQRKLIYLPQHVGGEYKCSKKKELSAPK